jgi:hypothetical protein
MAAKVKLGRCFRCPLPATHRAVIYETTRGRNSKRSRRVDDNELHKILGLIKLRVPVCGAHFLESEFSLWPFVCTKACIRAQLKEFTLESDDVTSWLSLRAVLAGVEAKCGYCGKKLKSRPNPTPLP